MEWYFASRTKNIELVKSAIDTLVKHNHRVTFDWTTMENLKPYYENMGKCGVIANKISESISKAEVFVLISDAEGTDMFIELGIAIVNWEQNKKKRIYVVGKYGKRSLMHLHPSIKHVKNLKDVFIKECPEILFQ